MITEEKVMDTLKKVMDPHIMIDIVSLGLIYDIRIEDNNVFVDMTLTTPGCPMAKMIAGDAENAIKQMEGVGNVEVKLVFDPPWTPDRVSDDLKKKWGIVS